MLEAWDDFRFTIGASGRQGSRTLISQQRTALAERPGQPHPATFLQGDVGAKGEVRALVAFTSGRQGE